MEQIRTLKPDEIEIRVQQCSEKGTSFLLYKNARVDQKLLDEVFTPFGWQRQHIVLKDVIYCSVGVWDKEKQQWIWKTDAGAESYSDKEKGEASDSFKRACVNWDIGRELYSSPFIWISSTVLPTEEKKGKYQLKGYPNLYVSNIEYNKNKDIVGLSIKSKDKIVFMYPQGSFKDIIEDEGVKITPATQDKDTIIEFKKLVVLYGASKVSQIAKQLGISSQTATMEDVNKVKSSLEKLE